MKFKIAHGTGDYFVRTTKNLSYFGYKRPISISLTELVAQGDLELTCFDYCQEIIGRHPWLEQKSIFDFSDFEFKESDLLEKISNQTRMLENGTYFLNLLNLNDSYSPSIDFFDYLVNAGDWNTFIPQKSTNRISYWEFLDLPLAGASGYNVENEGVEGVMDVPTIIGTQLKSNLKTDTIEHFVGRIKNGDRPLVFLLNAGKSVENGDVYGDLSQTFLLDGHNILEAYRIAEQLPCYALITKLITNKEDLVPSLEDIYKWVHPWILARSLSIIGSFEDIDFDMSNLKYLPEYISRFKGKYDWMEMKRKATVLGYMRKITGQKNDV